MMDQQPKSQGPQRPAEQAAVVTTIVGGRPPGAGLPVGTIPRGIEVLVKKASVDEEFKSLLLESREEAAREIGLELQSAEAMMLRAVPAAQLESIIAQTVVPEEHRRAFLGKVAAVMLAAIGVVSTGCPLSLGSVPDKPPATKGNAPDRPRSGVPAPTGIAPDRPPPKKDEKKGDEKPKDSGEKKPAKKEDDKPPSPTRGIQPDRPKPSS